MISFILFRKKFICQVNGLWVHFKYFSKKYTFNNVCWCSIKKEFAFFVFLLAFQSKLKKLHNGWLQNGEQLSQILVLVLSVSFRSKQFFAWLMIACDVMISELKGNLDDKNKQSRRNTEVISSLFKNVFISFSTSFDNKVQLGTCNSFKIDSYNCIEINVFLH